jgi:hypothetical protein
MDGRPPDVNTSNGSAAHSAADLPASPNAVLIGADGSRLEINLRRFPFEYLMPLPEPVPILSADFPWKRPQELHLPIVRYRLASVTDGRAIYCYVRTEHR